MRLFGPVQRKGRKPPGKLERKWERRRYTDNWSADTLRIHALQARIAAARQEMRLLQPNQN